MSLTESKVLFNDDFTSEELDRSKWNVAVTGQVVNAEQQAYVDSPETLYLSRGEGDAPEARGALVIKAGFRPGYRSPEGIAFDFVSARINTKSKFEFTYGSAAARIRLPAGAGLWPAFWALGASEAWPEAGEIDIMENVGETDWVSSALHGPGYSGETPFVNRFYLRPDATQWHVYSVDWSSDSLEFRVDDAMVFRATRAMVEHYGRWSFDSPKYLILNLAVGGAYPLKTNGVREPYTGVPASTLQSIKDGRAAVFVDWVRVTLPPATAIGS